MKKVKITLAIVVLIGIAVAILLGITSNKAPKEVVKPTNQFTQKIEESIKRVENSPNNKFIPNLYKEILSEINTFHQENRFDSNPEVNDQWKEDLSNDLYTAYSIKFIAQSNTVFNNSEWNPSDLIFIKQEKDKLSGSNFLAAGSNVANEFRDIENILNKYYEISAFIAKQKHFSYTDYSLSGKFPMEYAREINSQAKEYRNNELKDTKLRNCTRLSNELEKIPNILFKAHVRYLENKIKYWTDMYTTYNSQRDFYNNLYKPIKEEIEELKKNYYDYETDYKRLLKKWDSENNKAYYYNYN